ncbi:ADAM family mig-17 [Biomphalaria glabrata]|nr:ADAM family mig-17-like [Biomphalaria glabrata]
MTQSDSSASHRSRRWAPIKMSHQIKIGPGPSRPLIIRKRQRVSAKVGVLVVVDNSIFRQYLLDNGGDHKVALARIRRYYGMVFAMIDQRYATITDPDLSISVKISGILVAERREDSGWLEQLVDWGTVPTHGMASIYTDRALKKFTKWLGGRRHLPEFDHAMIFTAYRLTIKQGIGLGGMAYLNAVCQTSSSVSIVADRGDFQCVKVATHELAHSLGANHDGDKQSKSCPPSGNYVMSPQPSHERHVLRNAFYFSPCSVRDMLIHLSKSSSACVNDDPPVYYSYELKRLPPGHLYTADMQCKLIFGKKSAFCTDGNVQDVMCGQLWCKDPHKVSGCRTNSYLTALPGTECGVNRICHLGECILDPAKNAINSPVPQIRIIPSRQRNNEVPSYRMKGPAATQKAQEKRNRTSARQDRCRGDKNDVYCQGLLQVNPGGCRRRAVRQYCCQTCNRYSPN